MNRIKCSKAAFGWLAIALGALSIILAGFFNPTQPPMHIATVYWPVYGAAVLLIAAGVLVVADS